LILCLLPGFLAAFFFMLAPYLAAQGATTGEALTAGPAMARRHWGPLMMVIIVAMAVTFPLAGVAGAAQVFLSQQLGQAWASLVGQLGGGLLGLVLALPLWLFFVSAMVLVETTDRGIPLRWND
jgi:hypothetical protein